MAGKNVVREDVVQVGFEVEKMPFQDIVDDINEMKSSLTGAVDDGENSLLDIAKTANKSGKEITSAINKGNDSIKELTKDAQNMGSEIKKSANKISSDFNSVKGNINSAKKDTDTFVKKLKEIASSGVDKIKHPIQTIKNALGSAKEATSGFVTKLKDIGKTSEESAEQAENSFSSMKSGIDSLKSAAAGLGIALGLKSIWDGVNDNTKALNQFRAATGVNVEEMKQYGEDIKDLYKNGMGESINDVAVAMAIVKNNTSMVGEAVAETTNNALLLSDTFDFDVTESVRSAQMLMDQFGVSGKDAYNLIVQGAQNGLDKNGDLLDTINEYAVHYKQLGFSANEMFNSLVSGAANGTFSVDKLGDAVKEFGVRVKDGSDTTVEGFRLAGLSSDKMVKKFSKGGDSAKQAFMETVNALKKMKDPIKQNIAGVNLFGTMWEDLGADGVFALANINGEINGTKDALKELSDIKYNDAGSALSQLARIINIEFADAAGVVVNSLIPAIKWTADLINENSEAIGKAIPYLLGFVGAMLLIKGVMSAFSKISGLFGKSSKDNPIGGMLSPFESLAKAKPTTILKGMANLAIIIAGMTALAVGLMALAPYAAKLTDIKSIMKFIAVIGVLGLVGSGLATLSGLIGNIPVSSVALGLANIAIIVAGMSALFLLIGATSLINFDLNRIMQIVKIIAVLGTVGAALSLFAGIVGMIPAPVILLGLANIALVLGGLSAIIIAFGALSAIPHFDEFISKGGETLANLFNIIGKISGSLIGGIGEGVSNSLPKIGKNLSDFAELIKPLVSVFNGADVSGIGSFFSSIGSFMILIAGNDILSFFTGGPDFVGIGKELSAFAESAEGFFVKVAGFPSNGFTNAAALFQSLENIGNIPNTGGLAQWFSGTNDFSALADGLKQLSNENVLNFFAKIADLPTAGFENAKLLFQSLKDIGNVPNSGGIAQLFSGTNDFAELAEKLPPFGEGMAKFYNSISVISDFNKISQLFDILNTINKTEMGNIAGKGTALTNFMNNAKGFFTGAGEVVAQLETVNSVAMALQNFFGIVSNIVNTSLANIDERLNITIALVQSSTNDFNMFGMTIVFASTSGAAAFLLLQTTVDSGMTAIQNKISLTMTQNILSIQNGMNSFNLNLKSGLKKAVVLFSNAVVSIRSEVNKLKNALNFSWALPKIKLPHFKINGIFSMEPPSTPSFDVEWYKNGGIMTKPTMFGINNGNAMVGGESGAEAILPLDKFWNNLKDYTQKGQATKTSDSYKTVNRHNSHTEYNTYSPQFYLTIYGGVKDERTLERKVKKWAKESMSEVFDSMSRQTEPIQET